MSVVLDANVVVALLVADERQPAAQAHLAEWLDAGEELHAPAVLPHEIANAAFNLLLHPFDLAHDGPDVAAITTQLRRRHATDSTRPPWSA